MGGAEALEILLRGWEEEIRAASIYARMAMREVDPHRRAVLEELSRTEQGHAARWEARLRELGRRVPAAGVVTLPPALELSLRHAPLDALIAHQEAEVHAAQLEAERREIDENSGEEQHELELLYRLKGLVEAEAGLVASRLARSPEVVLATMVHEELGLSAEAGGEPLRVALAGGISTAVGALVPVLPFLFLSGVAAVVAAAVVSLVAHFAVGAVKSLLTLRSWWASGLEMTVAGVLAGVATYAVGRSYNFELEGLCRA